MLGSDYPFDMGDPNGRAHRREAVEDARRGARRSRRTARAFFEASAREMSEADLLVTGRWLYTETATPRARCTGAFVRAERAHAGIRGVDARPRAPMPGVRAVLTAGDLPTFGAIPAFLRRSPPRGADVVPLVTVPRPAGTKQPRRRKGPGGLAEPRRVRQVVEARLAGGRRERRRGRSTPAESRSYVDYADLPRRSSGSTRRWPRMRPTSIPKRSGKSRAATVALGAMRRSGGRLRGGGRCPSRHAGAARLGPSGDGRSLLTGVGRPSPPNDATSGAAFGRNAALRHRRGWASPSVTGRRSPDVPRR